jgi:hypothetical protein
MRNLLLFAIKEKQVPRCARNDKVYGVMQRNGAAEAVP